MQLLPDNFFYFIIFFSLSLTGGITLLLTNKRNKLLIINAILFFLCAIRFCTEYYIQQLDSYEEVMSVVYFHRLVFTLSGTCIWAILWYYVRPLKGWKYEKIGNQLYFWVFLILPIPYFLYVFLYDVYFTVSPTPIDGYWKFSFDTENAFAKFSSFYLLIVVGVITIAIMTIEIIRSKKNRLPKILAALSFILLPLLINQLLIPTDNDQWKISNNGIVLFAFTTSITWFVSDYRFFYNSFYKTIEDLLDSVSDLAIFTDTKFKISHINELATKEFQPNIEKQKITTVLVQYGQYDLSEIEKIIHYLIKEKTASKELILQLNGLEKIFALKAAKFEQGNLHLGYTFLLTDLTNIREKERQLEIANATKDRLFAIISHDLRKPALAFRGISKKVKFLLNQNEFATLEQYGTALEKAAYSMNALLDNLLNWALQQRNVIPYKPVLINVAEATNEVLELFQPTLQEKGIYIDMTIPEAFYICADFNAYSVIIRNLVDNAVKFTPKGGKVYISAKREASRIAVKITDTGIGMSKEKIEQLFKLKVNKSQQGTGGEKGTGLGLTLVKDLVELNKGTINVNSEKGKGSEFEILFPTGKN